MDKRVSIFCGHYGSGKTNIAVAYAKQLAVKGNPVTVCDLDIVNPYYRTKDSEAELNSLGIELLSSPFANSNVDVPALPSSFYRISEDKTRRYVVDVGGDDRGSLALGRYSDALFAENAFDMYMVVNFLRPLTRTAQDALVVMREITDACRLPFTAIVNNTNLGAETTVEVIRKGYAEACKLSELCRLPIAFTSLEVGIAAPADIPNTFSMALQKRPV